MTPLALTGSAIAVTGAARSKRRMLLRLRSPHSNAAPDERDGALVRDGEELAVARARGFKAAVLLEDACLPVEGEGFEVTVRLGSRFGILETAISLVSSHARGDCGCCIAEPRGTTRSLSPSAAIIIA
jgi:hypothetical protein